VLVAAVFDGGSLALTLTFDRAVDIAGIDAAQLAVQDEADTGLAYGGASAVMGGDATVVVVTLIVTGAGEGPTVMNASAATGIVAVDDGGVWGGVTNLALPFP
jgi:hypothetical protein